MIRTVVVDLDGTLCDSSHRDHYARNKQWDEFHAALGEDKLWPDVAAVLRALCLDGVRIVALSGRNERYRGPTIDWLLRHNLFEISQVILRPNNDYTPDHILKPEMLRDELFEGDLETAKKDVMFILEDREKVVQAWRDLGFRCWQVQPGGY
jgi:phosphoglycolate phosphatase-like HAD superfamily hydrolase